MQNVPVPARILDQAAEQVRAFNHASISTGTDWQYPSHSYDALGNLAYLLRMLPQAIEQAARPALHTHEHGRLAVDGAGDPDAAVLRLRAALDNAVRAATTLARDIDVMHTAASPMGARIDDEDDGQADGAPASCARCNKPFDPTDARFDGRAQHKLTPYCRGCVDNCGDGGTEHVCVICDPKRYGGEDQ